ncbi:LysR family transcriptional regulator [Pseudomonas sp. S25]|uniref:LysR family transcriptional regulator n=1 Tax=Pseudomonas maioricensis TaxID=1766623 RepID=A0ABS9ZGV3_9PSED|nr:LysR substrate-binding domain-containing protein [Pseudomonas sp. S25]MCI8209830.1 LysR family transcriptional regulator [Pseudomonas sp. S25]
MQSTLDIDLLRTFQAVVRFEQFLAAATFLNRSPSAVSLHIRRLEEITGGRLLERDNQNVTLTPLGRRFALQSAELLQAHDQLLAGFRSPTISGRVRLGISEEYAAALLHSTLAPLTSGYPQIELEVETASSGRLIDQLQRGQLDLALLVVPIDASSPDQPLKTFGTTEPVWVAAPGYQLRADKAVPLALHGEGCPYRSVAVDALSRIGRAWRTVVMSAGSSALETTICAGMAVGIIDRSRVSAQMRILGAEEGLPPLPLHRLQLVKAAGEASAACDILIGLISDHFRP